MPAFTQTFKAFFGGSNNGTNNGLDTASTLPRQLNGNNLGHSRHGFQYFKFRGSANSLGSNMDFDPSQVTKVEFRCYFANTWHQNGRATNIAQSIFLVPGSESSTHPYGMWQTYYGVAANAQPLPNILPNWPTPDGYTHTEGEEWFVLDDGTDLRSAFASNPNWDTGTGDGYNEGAVHIPVVLKMSIAGETGAADNAYFIDVANYNNATFEAELRITYEAQPDLLVSNGTSVSGQSSLESVNLRGLPEAAARWHGDKPELLDVYRPVVPYQTAGSGDLPPTLISGQVENPLGQGWLAWTLFAGAAPTQCRARMSTNIGPGTHPNGANSLYMENYNACRGYWHWDCDYYRPSGTTRPLNTASGVFSVLHTAPPASGDGEPMGVEAYKDGVLIWSIMYRAYADSGFPNYYPYSMQVTLRQYVGGFTGTPFTTTRYVNGTWDRWEFQVSNDAPAGEQLKARLYRGTNTTPSEELQLACDDVTFDELKFGATKYGFVGGVGSTYHCDIEVWDDYYLNGKWKDPSRMGELYDGDHWDLFEFDGVSQFTELDYAGVVTQESPLIVDETNLDQFDLADFYAERWAYEGVDDTSPLAYNQYELNYSNQGSALHGMTLYTPKGTPPQQGWDTILWLHGGFFISGSRGEINKGFVMDLINRGYAVATIDIILSSFEPVRSFVDPTSSTEPYPAWNPNIASARHPTQILDFKLAATWLQDPTQKSTYNLSGNIIASGHSAGGYPAAAAMITKGLTADDVGVDYTLAGNNVTYGYPNIPDPEFLGAYVTAAPADLKRLVDNDQTVTAGLPYGGLGRYILTVTM